MHTSPDPVIDPIVVYGAYGHTGRFIVAELLRRGQRIRLAGRDAARLDALGTAHGGLEVSVADIDDAAALDRMLQGAAAVIHAAGPFAGTADAMARAALRNGVHYLDVAAEPDIVAANIESHAAHAAAAGIAFAPAMGFYGALGHLAAAAALHDWTGADRVTLAIALSSWQPTAGTRATIEAAESRRGGRRLRLHQGRLELTAGAAPLAEWDFPPPWGRQAVSTEFITSDAITLAQRFHLPAIDQLMTLAALKDLSDSAAPAPVDALGRSAQRFLIEAVALRGAQTRRAVVQGQDIYAVTAPLVVEAAQRLIRWPQRLRGLVTASDLGPAHDFLRALSPLHLQVVTEAELR